MRHLYIIHTYEPGLAPLYVGQTTNVAGRIGTHQRCTEHAEWWHHVDSNRLEVIDLGDVSKAEAEDVERKLIVASRPYANRAENPRWLGDRTVQAMTRIQFNRMVNMLVHENRLTAQREQAMAIWAANQMAADVVSLANRRRHDRAIIGRAA